MFAALKDAAPELFPTLGNLRGGTTLDIKVLANALNVGFFVYADKPLDGIASRQWMCSFDSPRGGYAHWILLYYIADQHFMLGWLDDGTGAPPKCAFSPSGIPPLLPNDYNLANVSAPVGSACNGGFS